MVSYATLGPSRREGRSSSIGNPALRTEFAIHEPLIATGPEPFQNAYFGTGTLYYGCPGQDLDSGLSRRPGVREHSGALTMAVGRRPQSHQDQELRGIAEDMSLITARASNEEGLMARESASRGRAAH
jgi:hypothetical protein